MTFTKVRGRGVTTTDNYTVGVITATKFVGPITGGGGGIQVGLLTATGLDVNGDADISGNLTVGGDFTTLNTTLREVELLHVDANSSATAGIITQRGSGDILNLFDATTEVLTVTDGGNVGLGMTDPEGLLHLKGANPQLIVMDTDTTEGNTSATLRLANATASGQTNHYWNIKKEGTDLVFDDGQIGSGVEERLRITSTGSVGIGTVTPTFASGSGLHLHVTDVPRFRITNSVTGTASTQGTDIRMESSDLIIQNKESANMRFYAGGSESLRIDSNGNTQYGGAHSGGPYQDGNARNLIDLGSGTLNRGLGWGGTNGNYANIWTEYSSGDLNFAVGLRPTGSSTGYVSSNGNALGRANMELTTAGDVRIRTAASGTVSNGSAVSALGERLRIHSDGKISTGAITDPRGCVEINTNSGTGDANTLILRRPSTSDYHAISFATGASTTDWSVGQNSAGDFEIFEDGSDSTTRLSVHTGGTVQVQNHLTSRNGIVQINQVTSTTRYSGSISSVDLITGSTFTPKTSAPRFLIMIFCPVNNSDDSDAGNQNTNFYHYGRIEYRKSGGGWIECNNQGSTSNQGGNAGHIELSPNRTGDSTTDYWSGNRYRMEHKVATVLVTNVGDCGASGTVQFKLRGYSSNGNFIQIGQPHGYGTDDNYPVQPWGFTVFELAPDNNSYTAY